MRNRIDFAIGRKLQEIWGWWWTRHEDIGINQCLPWQRDGGCFNGVGNTIESDPPTIPSQTQILCPNGVVRSDLFGWRCCSWHAMAEFGMQTDLVLKQSCMPVWGASREAKCCLNYKLLQILSCYEAGSLIEFL